jgi:biopolymer transport protein TolQ
VNGQYQLETSPVQFAMRAAARAAATAYSEIGRGLNGLATVAAIAPWLGLFGMVVGIPTAFAVGCDGPKSSCMAGMVERLSGSIWATALGLGLGLASLWCYRRLTGRLETLDREMKNARLELANQLSLYLG